jgi:hypothetical protein
MEGTNYYDGGNVRRAWGLFVSSRELNPVSPETKSDKLSLHFTASGFYAHPIYKRVKLASKPED